MKTQKLLIIPVLGLLFASSFAFAATPAAATTPIQHVVVIFQENVSFDHYFGTYPNALNPTGTTPFIPAANTPSVNGYDSALLNDNPNLVNPFRLNASMAVTCDNNHAYTAEQKAVDGGLMDKFVQNVGPTSNGCSPNTTMGYYDGNTVTALWEYAQNFAMSDNSFGTTYGPSSPGALNLIAGTTAGASPNIAGKVVSGTDIGDADPAFDDCSTGSTFSMTGPNIGTLLNTQGMTWGWFEGGFAPTATNNGVAACGSSHNNVAGASVTDYIPHHEPFQYYASTSNPHHLPPTSLAMVGHTDQANHQYDLSYFYSAAAAGNLPAVSFLKAAAYQDGHPGYSDPLDEQNFVVSTINFLQTLPQWRSTAVIIAYDDSDGWYDHVMGSVLTQSNDPTSDGIIGTSCGTAPVGMPNDRCGLGPRLPLLVVSPWAKANYVDHTLTDQTSIIRFIEDNWNLGRLGGTSLDTEAGSINNMFNFNQDPFTSFFTFFTPFPRTLFLNPTTGFPARGPLTFPWAAAQLSHNVPSGSSENLQNAMTASIRQNRL